MNSKHIEKLNLEKILSLEETIPIYTPRTSFHFLLLQDEQLLNDLTLNFDPFTIQVLKNEFEKYKDSLNKK